jgi:cyclophilin family peptidyl-prolyl cis-trans isomerase
VPRVPGSCGPGAVPSPPVTSEDKRQRHKAGHRSRIEAAREAQAKADRRRLITMGVVGLLVVVLIVAAIMLTGGDDGDDTADSTTPTSLDTSSTDTTAVDDAATTVSLPAPPEGAAIDGDTECPPTDGADERVASFAAAPPTCIEEGEDLVADITTSAGSITIDLDEEGAPTMVNNFVVLARYGFYDGLPFHRLIPDFMAQTGSSGTPDYGSGGPGYDLPDEEKPEEGYVYTAGDVAMARSDTVSGSQFFIVATDEGAAHLTPDYPLFGKVTEGQEIVQVIASQGDAVSNGAPTALVTIESVTIRPA